MPYVYLNGKIIPRDEAKISIDDRSYLYGEGLFETLRAFDGQAPLLKEHLKRLEWSATFLNLEFPSDENFSEIISDLCAKNTVKDARIRITLSRSRTPKTDSKGFITTQNLLIVCDAYADQSKNGMRLKTARAVINDAPPVATIKSTNYLAKILARFEATESGYDDGILLNGKGLVTEATTGNIFWVDEKNVLKTVAEPHGLLRGVMRTTLLNLAKEKNLIIKEDQITPVELANAREVFVTNSVVGIKPVIQIDSRQISEGEVGSITAMLSDLWIQKLKELLSAN